MRFARSCGCGGSRALLCLLFLAAATSSVHALPKPNGSGGVNGGHEDDLSEPKSSDSPSKDGNNKKIFTNLNENIQSSSTSLDVLSAKLEEDIGRNMKVRENVMRRYWKQTFEEIKASNPVVFGEEGLEHKLRNSRNTRKFPDEKISDKWKQFGDSGGYSQLLEENDLSLVNGESSHKPNGDEVKSSLKKPPRFDGFQTWEKQLQQWSEDVSLYLEETENQLNELLQPKESSGYDLSSFGVSSTNLKNLTQKEVDSTTILPKKNKQQLKSSTLAQRFPRLDLTSTSAPTGTLPIALTALDKTLPPIPKPRAVIPSEAIVPHTDISDKSKNIWIVTTGALPWMTGTSVNPLLRAAYLSTGRKEAGGSITLMLPWVERPADQKQIYGDEKKFASPEDQEEFIRTWLHDTANMKEASVELNIKWYTAWQEVLENSLYSMGDLIGLIPVSISLYFDIL